MRLCASVYLYSLGFVRFGGSPHRCTLASSLFLSCHPAAMGSESIYFVPLVDIESFLLVSLYFQAASAMLVPACLTGGANYLSLDVAQYQLASGRRRCEVCKISRNLTED